VRAFPGFQDMSIVNNQRAYLTHFLSARKFLSHSRSRACIVSPPPILSVPLPFPAIYCFKKALFLINAIDIRFGAKRERDPSGPSPFPIPHTSHLPVFADNVLPSILIHLGIIDLSTTTSATSASSLALTRLFPAMGGQAAAPANLNISAAADPVVSLLAAAPEHQQPLSPAGMTKADPVINVGDDEGPVLTLAQSYVLRAAAIDACERIVSHAHAMSAAGRGAPWLKDVTLPDLDIWLWAVAKDRPDYRALPRFVSRDTPFF